VGAAFALVQGEKEMIRLVALAFLGYISLDWFRAFVSENVLVAVLITWLGLTVTGTLFRFLAEGTLSQAKIFSSRLSQLTELRIRTIREIFMFFGRAVVHFTRCAPFLRKVSFFAFCKSRFMRGMDSHTHAARDYQLPRPPTVTHLDLALEAISVFGERVRLWEKLLVRQRLLTLAAGYDIHIVARPYKTTLRQLLLGQLLRVWEARRGYPADSLYDKRKLEATIRFLERRTERLKAQGKTPQDA
jgi:hypothetical protein